MKISSKFHVWVPEKQWIYALHKRCSYFCVHRFSRSWCLPAQVIIRPWSSHEGGRYVWMWITRMRCQVQLVCVYIVLCILIIQWSLTLGMHAQKGYSTCLVCVSVTIVAATSFISSLKAHYTRVNISSMPTCLSTLIYMYYTQNNDGLPRMGSRYGSISPGLEKGGAWLPNPLPL